MTIFFILNNHFNCLLLFLATMRVAEDFSLYNSGIYKCPKNSSSIGYHSVRIVGWSETDDSEQYWVSNFK